jgi:radical SAM superfamily enzyme YgiQ (UPF0313 family)
MSEIVLTTLNAKFIHAAFGLRYLYANLGTLQPRACLMEFDINQRPLDIAEGLLARNPKIIGFGVYIWNVTETLEVITAIRGVRPEVKIVLGGPEVSHETGGQAIVEWADHVITGEADLKFAEVCQSLLEPPAGKAKGDSAIFPKIIAAELPDFSRITLPYEFYSDADLAHRIVYVEASRGCPFTCEFCLSSLDIPVRQVPLANFLAAMEKLLDRGLKQFKFVDRTFNLNVPTSKAILEFFLERYQPGHFYHFEMVPDRLPAELRVIIEKFPAGALQFEVGIQTFNPEVGALISRRQNYERMADNFNFLRTQTRVHIHADLIVGLPGETLESFAAGFDRLIALGPQEIQVGILKRLRGTPISRHDAAWQMIYSVQPAYEILQNRLLDFSLLQRLRRFAKYWDLIGNSGNFIRVTPLIGSVSPKVAPRDEAAAESPSPFYSFLRLSDWLYKRLQRTDSIALMRLLELLFEYLTTEACLDKKLVAETLWEDYQTGGRHDKPSFLKDYLPANEAGAGQRADSGLPKRQARRLVQPVK